MNVLFVRSRNQWRSPTPEREFKRIPRIATRSAGTSRSARRRITIGDIRWADLILVMEEKHKSQITAGFRAETRYKQIHVLDIPDDYLFMDPELIALLREKVAPLIGNTPQAP
ncbi:MAG: protein tyrosine phosphatase [Alphaproteobacteria bacterium]|nr:protein tyrosine phosphatase [Alphaproteobacteria bacterium]